jgi:hypothetical protein
MKISMFFFWVVTPCIPKVDSLLTFRWNKQSSYLTLKMETAYFSDILVCTCKSNCDHRQNNIYTLNDVTLGNCICPQASREQIMMFEMRQERGSYIGDGPRIKIEYVVCKFTWVWLFLYFGCIWNFRKWHTRLWDLRHVTVTGREKIGIREHAGNPHGGVESSTSWEPPWDKPYRSAVVPTSLESPHRVCIAHRPRSSRSVGASVSASGKSGKWRARFGILK